MNKIDRVCDFLRKTSLHQYLVADPVSIAYLTGISIDPGERLFVLLLRQDGQHRLFINQLFPLPETSLPMTSFDDTDDSITLLADYLIPGEPVGIDKIWPARFLIPLMQDERVGVVQLSDAVDLVRAVKDDGEQAAMREASRLNDEAMRRTVAHARFGISELELADFLRQTYLELACSGPSFEPIVAFGEHAADPHHENSGRTLQSGDVLLLDIGGRLGDYCSDMTRTYFTAPPTPRQEAVYELVRSANEAAIRAVKPGVRLSEIDAAARDIISAAGFGPNFTHRLGHFIGREVHEYGDVSSVSDIIAEPGMIFSIEPGIYLPGEFGVRIEDLVLITADGCEVLNLLPKDLQRID